MSVDLFLYPIKEVTVWYTAVHGCKNTAAHSHHLKLKYLFSIPLYISTYYCLSMAFKNHIVDWWWFQKNGKSQHVVVVSPLHGLINDQVRSLCEFGCNTTTLTLDIKEQEREGNVRDLLLIHSRLGFPVFWYQFPMANMAKHGQGSPTRNSIFTIPKKKKMFYTICKTKSD